MGLIGSARRRRAAAPGALWAVALFLLPALLSGGCRGRHGPVDASARLAAGERIYRRGMLSSGAPVLAVVKGDVRIIGPAAACASCHLRSGFGSIEGANVSPPVNGTALFRPLALTFKGVENRNAPPRRPAYTDASLARALRTGIDAAGKPLGPNMPRYALADADMADLIAYLHSLSTVPSPGAEAQQLHLAIVVTDEVPAAERDALRYTIEKAVAQKNNQARFYENNEDLRSTRMAEKMVGIGSRAMAYSRLAPVFWQLRGEPGTWREQLEALYRQRPVFALLSGISAGEWRPIHEFSEAHELPCLLPNTDLPVISESDFYTVYLSRGYFEEGAAAARYLAAGAAEAQRPPGAVVELVRGTAAGEALATGFERAWAEAGRAAPVRVSVRPGEAVPIAAIEHQLGGGPSTLLLWDDGAALPAIESLASPSTIIASAQHLGEARLRLSDAARQRLLLTWPYRLPRDEESFRPTLAPWLNGPLPSGPTDEAGWRRYKVASGAYAAVVVLTSTLSELRGHYSREYFLEVMGMMSDQFQPTFARLSFGSGQRYLSKGAYLVQLGPGSNPEWIRRSEWLTH